MTASIDELMKVCRDVLAPLIRADGGELYIVKVEADHLSLHVAGRYSGCPGTPLVITAIVEPTIKAIVPSAKVEVTSGIYVPSGASRIDEDDKGEPGGATTTKKKKADAKSEPAKSEPAKSETADSDGSAPESPEVPEQPEA